MKFCLIPISLSQLVPGAPWRGRCWSWAWAQQPNSSASAAVLIPVRPPMGAETENLGKWQKKKKATEKTPLSQASRGADTARLRWGTEGDRLESLIFTTSPSVPHFPMSQVFSFYLESPTVFLTDVSLFRK